MANVVLEGGGPCRGPIVVARCAGPECPTCRFGAARTVTDMADYVLEVEGAGEEELRRLLMYVAVRGAREGVREVLDDVRRMAG